MRWSGPVISLGAEAKNALETSAGYARASRQPLPAGGAVNGFCLVSSDSDFTRLAARICEQGLMAYGFGERKTPKPFVAACAKFVYVENLARKETTPNPAATPGSKKDPTLDKLLSESVDTSADDDGWAHLGAVGSNLSRLASDFDTRTGATGNSPTW